MNQAQISHHILPNASNHAWGLVDGHRPCESRRGAFSSKPCRRKSGFERRLFFDQLHVLLFQHPERQSRRQHAQQIGAIADIFFMIGLIAMTLISVLFAYEFV
jgi:hypothetical protein